MINVLLQAVLKELVIISIKYFELKFYFVLISDKIFNSQEKIVAVKILNHLYFK